MGWGVLIGRPRVSVRLMAAALAAVALACSPAPALARKAPPRKPNRHKVARAAPCMDTDAVLATAGAAIVRASVLCLVNEQRAAADLPPLSAEDHLQSAAQGLSDDMVRRDYFDHVTPDGRKLLDRVRATHYLDDVRAYGLGETIGFGTGEKGTPAAIVAAFMASPPHRAVILTRGLRELGVGVTDGVPGDLGPGATYALDYGWTGSPQA